MVARLPAAASLPCPTAVAPCRRSGRCLEPGALDSGREEHASEPLRTAGGSLGLTPNTGFYTARPPRGGHAGAQLGAFPGEGFIKVTGEVGTGKTPALSQAAERASARGLPGAPGLAAQPHLTPGSWCTAPALELGLTLAGRASWILSRIAHSAII